MSSEPRVIAEFNDYPGLIEGLRTRAQERKLALSSDENATIAGLPDKYLPKLIGVNPVRRLGIASLGAVLGVLGAKLILVVDEEAERRYANRSKTRNSNLVRGNTTYFILTERKLHKWQTKGRKNRWAKLSKEERSKAMRAVVKARWSKPRVVEIKGEKAQRARVASKAGRKRGT